VVRHKARQQAAMTVDALIVDATAEAAFQIPNTSTA
jgi:hypothetical protein